MQPADLAGAVTPADVSRLSAPNLVTSVSNTAIQNAFALAQDSTVLASLFDAEADALALGTRLLDLLGTARQTIRVTQQAAAGLSIVLLGRGKRIDLTHPRLNGGAAKSYLLIGAEIDAAAGLIHLVLWG